MWLTWTASMLLYFLEAPPDALIKNTKRLCIDHMPPSLTLRPTLGSCDTGTADPGPPPKNNLLRAHTTIAQPSLALNNRSH
ncbi:hypothetical protein IW262DRAFT_1357581 [Armillaria fumosa]|nr:hypothetical protein IW262DRAFT_1357581 [Armillaria fumosa]